MAAIDQYISDFIKDAQYRIAEIGTELDGMNDADAKAYKDLEYIRQSLYQFLEVLYVGEWSIYDGYNHLDWDDHDIKLECEYLRSTSGMVNSSFMTFVSYYPTLVSEAGDALPSADAGNFILYDANNDPQTVDFPTAAGANDSDTPETYFS